MSETYEELLKSYKRMFQDCSDLTCERNTLRTDLAKSEAEVVELREVLGKWMKYGKSHYHDDRIDAENATMPFLKDPEAQDAK